MRSAAQQRQDSQFPVNVVGSSTFGRYKKISDERTYNMYITDDWLVNYAGYKKVLELLSVSNAEGRGIFRSIRNDIVVVVVNSSVFMINSSLTPTFIGTIATGSGYVSMDENLNNQIAIVDGLNIYIFNYALRTLTKQTLNVNLIPNYVSYHNTYFLLGNNDSTSNGAAWYAFSYETDTTITETTQLALQTKPDYAIAVKRIPGGGNNVIVFGTSVCELWTQVGGEQNYQRNSSINIDYGCLSISTIASSDKYVVWLGVNESDSPVIMMFTNAGAINISTDGIDHELGKLKYPEQSTAFFYREDGHLFYQLTFYNPEDNLSLIYDINTKKFFHISDANLNYHPANGVVYFNNMNYFISLNNGDLYQSSTNFTTYNENLYTNNPLLEKEIPRIRICGSLRRKNSFPFRARNLIVTMDQGNDPRVSILSLSQGLNYMVTESPNSDFIITEQNQNIVEENDSQISTSTEIRYSPRVDLSISRDGGVTFSSELPSRLNAQGHRQNMLRWAGSFGRANDLTFKLRFLGTSYFCVSNGTVDIY